jgi:hypothetical protein
MLLHLHAYFNISLRGDIIIHPVPNSGEGQRFANLKSERRG